MIERKTHFSQVEKKRLEVSDELLTESSHAHGLDIKTMVRQGFVKSRTDEPMYGDFSEIPDLDTLVINRRRLTQLYSSLPNKVKQKIPTLDEFMRVMSRQDEDELIECGLLNPSKDWRINKLKATAEELGIDMDAGETSPTPIETV